MIGLRISTTCIVQKPPHKAVFKITFNVVRNDSFSLATANTTLASMMSLSYHQYLGDALESHETSARKTIIIVMPPCALVDSPALIFII